MGASRSVCQKTGAISPVSCIIKETGVVLWRMNRPILCGQYKKEACKG